MFESHLKTFLYVVGRVFEDSEKIYPAVARGVSFLLVTFLLDKQRKVTRGSGGGAPLIVTVLNRDKHFYKGK